MEIGSEFWISEKAASSTKFYLPDQAWLGQKQYYVSGRTALYAIIKEIIASSLYKHPLTAYLPSLCCHTMIEPFLQHDVSVDFYPVVFRDGSLHQLIDNKKQCDMILVMDYFGFASEQVALPDNAIIIRDMTHALYSSNTDAKISSADYVFASYRKWGAVTGVGVACKKIGEWESASKRYYSKYISLRNRGYKLKAQYISGKAIEKREFLEIFNNAEELLERDYIDYKADDEAISLAATLYDCMSNKRRKNAKILFEGLKSLSVVEPMFKSLTFGEVPLFVPVLVKDGQRDALRKYLIENAVYCPIHWPITNIHKLTAEEQFIYSSELSLICDQRYTEKEMLRQLELIRSFELSNGKYTN